MHLAEVSVFEPSPQAKMEERNVYLKVGCNLVCDKNLCNLHTLTSRHDGMDTDACVLSELGRHPFLLDRAVFRLLEHE